MGVIEILEEAYRRSGDDQHKYFRLLEQMAESENITIQEIEEAEERLRDEIDDFELKVLARSPTVFVRSSDDTRLAGISALIYGLPFALVFWGYSTLMFSTGAFLTLIGIILLAVAWFNRFMDNREIEKKRKKLNLFMKGLKALKAETMVRGRFKTETESVG